MHRQELTLPAQCEFNEKHDEMAFYLHPGRTLTADDVKAEDFVKSACDNITSCLEWRQLLRDVLELGSKSETELPSGITVNLEEPPPRRPSSPLSSVPESRPASRSSRHAGHHRARLGSPSARTKGRQYVGASPPKATSSKRKGGSGDSVEEEFVRGECFPLPFPPT